MSLPIRGRPSPNHDARPPGAAIDMLVLHYTGMRTAEEALRRLCDPDPPTRRPVSSHYVVEENGTTWQLVPEERRAWHAGVSYWRGREGLNAASIGVEIVNPGHDFGYCPFPAPQMAAVRALCLGILERWPIPARNVVAHSDIAPDRKQDPGELFDWACLAASGIGVWPSGVPDLGVGEVVRDAAGLRDVRGALPAIGYRVANEGAADAELACVLRAFQRHWRQEAVTGEADAGTRTRLSRVANMTLVPGSRADRG